MRTHEALRPCFQYEAIAALRLPNLLLSLDHVERLFCVEKSSPSFANVTSCRVSREDECGDAVGVSDDATTRGNAMKRGENVRRQEK